MVVVVEQGLRSPSLSSLMLLLVSLLLLLLQHSATAAATATALRPSPQPHLRSPTANTAAMAAVGSVSSMPSIRPAVTPAITITDATITTTTTITTVTATPTLQPTITPQPSTCPPFNGSYTDNGRYNTTTCNIWACSGYNITLDACSVCSFGLPIIILRDMYHNTLLRQALNCANCSSLATNQSTVTLTTYEDCQYYQVAQGCSLQTACSFTTQVNLVKTSILSPSTSSPGFYCAPYSVFNTSITTANYWTCQFYVCPANTITISNCGPYCYGMQAFALYQGASVVSANLIQSVNGGCGPCGYMSYTHPSSATSCQLFTLQETCVSGSKSNPCSGKVFISGSTASQMPSMAPTAMPSVSTNYEVQCPPYTLTNTSSATQNFVPCTLPTVCAGALVLFGNCGQGCVGDQFLSLVYNDPSGASHLLVSNDNGCQNTLCSSIAFSYSGQFGQCVSLVIQQGCFASGTCSGTVTGTVTIKPTPAPTISMPPTFRPTSLPTTRTPTAKPSISMNPSALPTPSPSSFAPTTAPSPAPSLVPSAMPSDAPTAVPSPAPSASPSAAPSEVPTPGPTNLPSSAPTAAPSAGPTEVPSASPTAAPSAAPSVAPSAAPTAAPSASPSAAPSATPSTNPSAGPSSAPTLTPSRAPTTSPSSRAPSLLPTAAPTSGPSFRPSLGPSAIPSVSPTQLPSAEPTSEPSLPSNGSVIFSNGSGAPSSGPSSGMIAGVVLAVVAILLAAAFAAYYFYFRDRRSAFEKWAEVYDNKTPKFVEKWIAKNSGDFTGKLSFTSRLSSSNRFSQSRPPPDLSASASASASAAMDPVSKFNSMDSAALERAAANIKRKNNAESLKITAEDLDMKPVPVKHPSYSIPKANATNKSTESSRSDAAHRTADNATNSAATASSKAIDGTEPEAHADVDRESFDIRLSHSSFSKENPEEDIVFFIGGPSVGLSSSGLSAASQALNAAKAKEAAAPGSGAGSGSSSDSFKVPGNDDPNSRNSLGILRRSRMHQEKLRQQQSQHQSAGASMLSNWKSLVNRPTVPLASADGQPASDSKAFGSSSSSSSSSSSTTAQGTGTRVATINPLARAGVVSTPASSSSSSSSSSSFSNSSSNAASARPFGVSKNPLFNSTRAAKPPAPAPSATATPAPTPAPAATTTALTPAPAPAPAPATTTTTTTTTEAATVPASRPVSISTAKARVRRVSTLSTSASAAAATASSSSSSASTLDSTASSNQQPGVPMQLTSNPLALRAKSNRVSGRTPGSTASDADL